MVRSAFAIVPLLFALTGCGGGGDAAPPATASQTRTDGVMAALGKDNGGTKHIPADTSKFVAVGERLFKDTNLSVSKQLACVSCHAENAGHADRAGTKLPLGGPTLTTSGMRSSPTVRYLNENTAFRIDRLGVPWGGFTWDGRADSRAEQAGAPFFEAPEMALPGSPSEPAALTALVRAADYYPDLKALYKKNEIDSDRDLFARITELIAIYQRDDPDYNAFDSRFDGSRAGTQALTPSEARGLAIFNDSNRGNCMTCHTSSGAKPLFTNFGYAALGVPRNHEGPKNLDPAFFDLGLCMRERAKSEQKKRAAGDDRYCGMFKTPTLRNVAQTAPYFHNGSVATLEAAVRFHFERDTQPAKWYRRADGTPDATYNDLPVKYQNNLARGRPFSGSYSPTDAEIADLVAFLKTLTDADQFEITK